jgi:hypothetical protein
MEEMFAFDTPDINTFRTMYQASTPAPVLVKADETTDLSVEVDDLRELGVRIFPNPVRNGLLNIDGLSHRVLGIEVYDLRGALVAGTVPAGQRSWQVRLPSTSATYMVVVRTATRNYVERVVAF